MLWQFLILSKKLLASQAAKCTFVSNKILFPQPKDSMHTMIQNLGVGLEPLQALHSYSTCVYNYKSVQYPAISKNGADISRIKDIFQHFLSALNVLAVAHGTTTRMCISFQKMPPLFQGFSTDRLFVLSEHTDKKKT